MWHYSDNAYSLPLTPPPEIGLGLAPCLSMWMIKKCINFSVRL